MILEVHNTGWGTNTYTVTTTYNLLFSRCMTLLVHNIIMIIVINIIIINSSSPPTSAPGGQHHPSTLVETEFEKNRFFLEIIWTALNPVTELHLSVSRIISLQHCMLVRLPCLVSNQCPVAVVFQ